MKMLHLFWSAALLGCGMSENHADRSSTNEIIASNVRGGEETSTADEMESGSAAMTAGPSSGDQRLPTSLAALFDKVEGLDERCRGGSGDNPSTLLACNERYYLLTNLEKVDWCWEDNEQTHWRKCSEDSDYRPGQYGTEPPYSDEDINLTRRQR